MEIVSLSWPKVKPAISSELSLSLFSDLGFGFGLFGGCRRCPKAVVGRREAVEGCRWMAQGCQRIRVWPSGGRLP